MGYFSNATEWEGWAGSNCFRCAHWPKGELDAPCPVEMAHMVYNYDLCNEDQHPGKIILDMLIPRNKGDTGNLKCAMFKDRAGVSDKHLRDWEKYKAAMQEAAQGTSAFGQDGNRLEAKPAGPVRKDAPNDPAHQDNPRLTRLSDRLENDRWKLKSPAPKPSQSNT